MAMNSYVLSGLGGGGGSSIREPRTAEEPALASSVTWWKGLGPPGWRGLRLCSWEWGDAVRAGPSGLRRGSAPWFLSPSEWCHQWGMGWALGIDLWAELQHPRLRNGVASPLGNELGWAALWGKGASW